MQCQSVIYIVAIFFYNDGGTEMLKYGLVLLIELITVAGCTRDSSMQRSMDMAELIKQSEESIPYCKYTEENSKKDLGTIPLAEGEGAWVVPHPVREDIQDVVDLSGTIVEEVGLKVIGKHADAKNVYFTVLLRNSGEKGQKVRLRALGYDKNSRLVQADGRALYIQPREMLLQNYTFPFQAGVTQWQMSVQ